MDGPGIRALPVSDTLQARRYVHFDGRDAFQTPSIDHGGATSATIYAGFSCTAAGGDRIVTELSSNLGTSPNAYAFYRRFDDKRALVGHGGNNRNDRVSAAQAVATAELKLGRGVFNLRLRLHEASVHLDGGPESVVTAIFGNDVATIRIDVLNIDTGTQSALFLKLKKACL